MDLLPTALEPVTNPISGDADIYGIFHPSSLTAAYSAWNLTNVQNGLADGSIVFVLTSGEENTETTGEVEELEGPAEEPSDDPSAATIVEWVRGGGPKTPVEAQDSMEAAMAAPMGEHAHHNHGRRMLQA